jgi:YD repeat-containing protein
MSWIGALKRYGLCLLCIAFIFAAIAEAQMTSTIAPPPDSAIDDNHVDLMSGELVLSGGTLSIGGSERSGLSYSYFPTARSAVRGTPFGGVHAWDRFGVRYIVTFGMVSERFNGNDFSSFTPEMNNGTTFAYDQANARYVYTTRDGTVALFSASLRDPVEANRARLTAVIYPSGERLDYTYSLVPCPPPGTTGNCPSYRPKAVISNTGYQMRFTGTTRVTLFNMAVDYCDPAAETCPAFTQSWPSVQFSTSAPWMATDALNRTTTYLAASSSTSMTFPSGRQITFKYAGPPQCASPNDALTLSGPVVSWVSDGIRTWNYGYSETNTCDEVNNVRTVTVSDPQGHQRIVKSNPWKAGLISDRNELAQTTSYITGYRRISQITYPEGNSTKYEYDGRGNVTKITRVAKSGSGLADIVITQSFDATCSNPKTCNRPNYSIDARGARTDYTYDPNHGGVLTITYPAPASGLPRPQIRYGYTALFAFFKNSSGQIVQAPTLVYKLTISLNA